MSLGGKPPFLVSPWIAEILTFSKLSIYTEADLLKTFLQHFHNFVSTGNVQEVMKFYYLVEQSVETDFNFMINLFFHFIVDFNRSCWQ